MFLASSLPIIKPKRLTKSEKENFTLSSDLFDIIVGLLLGDLYARRRNVDTKLYFKQGVVHKEYVSHLYDIFRLYCSNVPKTTNNPPHPKTGKIYVSMTFETFTLPCFNELYDLFYVAGKKVIPNNISELLTAAGLAYWICDDGSWNKHPFGEGDMLLYVQTLSV